jgi:hypothetical protein
MYWSEPLGLEHLAPRNWYTGWTFHQEKVMP